MGRGNFDCCRALKFVRFLRPLWGRASPCGGLSGRLLRPRVPDTASRCMHWPGSSDAHRVMELRFIRRYSENNPVTPAWRQAPESTHGPAPGGLRGRRRARPCPTRNNSIDMSAARHFAESLTKSKTCSRRINNFREVTGETQRTQRKRNLNFLARDLCVNLRALEPDPTCPGGTRIAPIRDPKTSPVAKRLHSD